MQEKRYLTIELILLFIGLPVFLACIPELQLGGKLSFILGAGSVLIGLVYMIYTIFKKTQIRFNIQKEIAWTPFFRRVLMTFLIMIVVTIGYVYSKDPSALFCVPRTNIPLYITILFVYSLLSVWPQEVIYRTFFYERYTRLFTNEKAFIFIGSLVFMLAHLMFRNVLVLLLTFIGGVLFSITYLKTKSTLLASIEHAIYGNWLFTVGMGKMLEFPGMDEC